MKQDGALEEILQRTIQRRLYAIHRGPCEVLVKEQQEKGRAEVRCAVPDGARCVEWIIEKNLFPFLLSSECTDGVMLIERTDGAFDAHVLECKITINQDSRSKAKTQMRWTLVRLQALAGALGLRLEQAVLYTAYCNDQLTKDPGLLKIPLGAAEASSPEDAEAIDALRGQFDWPEAQLELRGFEGRFAHHTIQMTPPAKDGEPALGRCTLRSP